MNVNDLSNQAKNLLVSVSLTLPRQFIYNLHHLLSDPSNAQGMHRHRFINHIVNRCYCYNTQAHQAFLPVHRRLPWCAVRSSYDSSFYPHATPPLFVHIFTLVQIASQRSFLISWLVCPCMFP